MSSSILNNIAKMSAAGAGKTWDICHDALEMVKLNNKRALIVTYTNRSAESARKEIRKQNNGVDHSRVIIKTWYRFLLSEMIKPYQTYVTGGRINHIKSIDFSERYGQINKYKGGTYIRYINAERNVRSNQASELAMHIIQCNKGKTIERLEKIYSSIYFDEVQDFAGYDIDLLTLLMKSSISITVCGDNKQATYRTHVTRKNKKQTGVNIWDYFRQLEEDKMIKVERNLSSRRFNSDICYFANTVFPLGDPISTIMNEATGHDGVFLIDATDAEFYYDFYSPQILRFDVRTLIDKPCLNFGACKGETFDRVLIYPNNPLNEFILKGKPLKAPEKYYVGVTRPKYSLTFVINQLPTQLKGFSEVFLSIDKNEIRALRLNCK